MDKKVEKLIHVKELTALEPGKVYVLKMTIDNYEVGDVIAVIVEMLKILYKDHGIIIQFLVECPGMKFEFVDPNLLPRVLNRQMIADEKDYQRLNEVVIPPLTIKKEN